MAIKIITKNTPEYGNFDGIVRLDTENNSIKLVKNDQEIQIKFDNLSDIDLFQGQIEILRRNGKFAKF